jgi:hypothetical protein
MKSTTAATLVLALSTLVAGQAMAASNIDTSNPSELDFAMNVVSQKDTAPGKTRELVPTSTHRTPANWTSRSTLLAHKTPCLR